MTSLDMSHVFILFRDDKAGSEFLFANPVHMIIAEGAADFDDALKELQTAHENKKWLAGYFSYEAGFLLEPKLKPLLPLKRRVPLLCFGVFDAPSERQCPYRIVPPLKEAVPFLTELRAVWNFEEYQDRFSQLHQHLRKGNCYQGNLTFPIQARWSESDDLFAAFNALTTHQPVRYGVFSTMGGFVILSRSPELFFKVDEQGWIEAHPMKGTVPRGKTREEDDHLRAFLINDPKNQAENRMIVDLLRNDISLISEIGTLDVSDLFKIECYPTVYQMISCIRAHLVPNLTLREIFAALFPCGSITGAPKIRAIEILSELESTPRNIYCGTIGWITPQGGMQFNVAIRTIALYSDGCAVFNVGGGVIFDSTAEEEYAECLLKTCFVTGEMPTTLTPVPIRK